MSIVLVADIFGLTPALLAMAKKLGGCTIVDPYEAQMMHFKTEQDAYAYFVNTVGLDGYLTILSKVVESIKQQVTLIGFSVGASAIWRLSDSDVNNKVKQAVCYYGSQIRNFKSITPRFKINLVFPASEAHFDVVALQNSLSTKDNVTINSVKYLHGFMNYHSSNYSELGYREHIEILCSTASK